MSTPTNRWAIGEMYFLGLLNGQPFYTQAGGPGTAVTPTQRNGEPWLDYPTVGQVINEFMPFWTPGCGHSICTWKLIKEWDYDTNMDCCLVACEVCSYVQSVIEPYDLALNPQQYAIIIS